MKQADLEARIRTLEDIEEIKRLKCQYWRCLDGKLWAELEQCFARGATADYGPRFCFRGRKAIVAFLKQFLGRDSVTTFHMGHNAEIEMTGIAAGIDGIDGEAKDEIGQSVTALNGLLEQVFELNFRLRSASETGAERNDLVDQRDKLVREIAQYVDVRTVERENGAISLFTPAGLSLVDGPPSKFVYDGANIYRTEDPATAVVTLFRDGKIRALLDFRLDNSGKALPVSSDPSTEVIRKLRSQLDAVVKAMTSTTGATFSSAYVTSNRAEHHHAGRRYSPPDEVRLQHGESLLHGPGGD